MITETSLFLISFTIILNSTSGFIRAQYPPKSKARIRCLYIPITLIILVRTYLGASWSIVPFLFILAIACIFLGGFVAKSLGKGYQKNPLQENEEPTA